MIFINLQKTQIGTEYWANGHFKLIIAIPDDVYIKRNRLVNKKYKVRDYKLRKLLYQLDLVLKKKPRKLLYQLALELKKTP